MKLLIVFLVGILLAGIPAQSSAVSGNVSGNSTNVSGSIDENVSAHNDYETVGKKKPILSKLKRNETVEVKQFKAKYKSNYSWQIRQHKDRNSPHWIDGFYPIGKDIKNREEAEATAINIITDSKDLLKISDVSDLKLRRTMEDKWTFIPEFDQYYKGVQVYGGEVRVILNKNNVFSGLTNTFYPDIDISTEPKITKEGAVEIAIQNTRPNLTANQTSKIVNYST